MLNADVTSNAPELARPLTPKAATPMEEEMVTAPNTAGSNNSEHTAAHESAEGEEDNDMHVDDAAREFICMNDEFTPCKTGQYTMELSRKVISDHFGRNKACTRDITDWPLFCRKHYQRATYNKEKWQLRKIALILRQLDIIEKQHPGTTYNIHFKKSEETRLNQYSRQVAAGMAKEEAEKTVKPVVGKHFEAPVDVLRELDQWLGNAKSQDDVKKVVDVILQMLEEKDTEQVPSIEFLPQLPGKLASPKKAAAKSRSPKSPKTPTRVSTKGSVKKTLQKA